MNHALETTHAESADQTTRSNAVYVGIAAILGGASLGAVFFITLFSPENLSVTPWIVGGLSALGIALGYFVSKQR